MNARERRVIGAGAGVLALAALITFVLLPVTTRWQLRSARREALTVRVEQLQSLIARETMLQQAASAQELALSAHGRRLLHAPSSALAASALQSLLQDAADASQLLVDRVDVPVAAPTEVGELDTTSTSQATSLATSLAASLSVTGDIHGLAALLDLLQRGPRALQVERLTVQINPALRGASDVLQSTIGVRAPVVIDR